MNLYLFEVPLGFPEGVRAVSSMGSVFHGALMEQLPAEVAAHLHTEELRPYHQSILFTRERGAVWRFGVLDEGLFLPALVYLLGACGAGAAAEGVLRRARRAAPAAGDIGGGARGRGVRGR